MLNNCILSLSGVYKNKSLNKTRYIKISELAQGVICLLVPYEKLFF